MGIIGKSNQSSCRFSVEKKRSEIFLDLMNFFVGGVSVFISQRIISSITDFKPIKFKHFPPRSLFFFFSNLILEKVILFSTLNFIPSFNLAKLNSTSRFMCYEKLYK